MASSDRCATRSQQARRAASLARGKRSHLKLGLWKAAPSLAASIALVSSSTTRKFGGPKGEGALIFPQGTDIAAQIKGGGQEMGRRSGTENVIGLAGFGAAADIVLVEASPQLRMAQADTLDDFEVRWVDGAADLPSDAPLWCVANEFFDALPIRQFVRDADGWRERCIGAQDGALSFGLAPAGEQPQLNHRLEDTQDGDVVETCPAAHAILSELGHRIADQGGVALIIDYGDWRALGDTLQAVKDHDRADLLDMPGTADITAHVDFEALTQAAAPAAHTRLTPQGVFLERLGMTARAQALAKRLEGAALETHVAAHRRLTHPDEMGNLFKVLGLFPASSAPPPGLST